ncbi:MAG: ABC transporter ATP-binding protein, partial [Lachnospiraceae bacterium]|nr:ABC transporter ATP-binding protein [Lachnospiraceae bacterium]
WKAQKALQAEARKKANDLKTCEDRIEKIENRISEIDEEMSEPDVATNSGKLNELTKERSALESELEELMERWEALS